jgi:hypothetical protein
MTAIATDLHRSRDATYRRYREFDQKLWEKYRGRIIAAHPETEGNILLVNNWGNDQARQILERYEQISRRLTARSKKEYNLADHRGHHNQPPHHFRPMWCLYCQSGSERARKNFRRDYPSIGATYYPVHVVKDLLSP